MPRLVMVEIFAADGRGWNEAVGSGLDQSNKQARAYEPCDSRLNARADSVGEIGGDKAVGRLALRRHGAPLGIGDGLGDLIKLFHLGVSQAIIAKVERSH